MNQFGPLTESGLATKTGLIGNINMSDCLGTYISGLATICSRLRCTEPDMRVTSGDPVHGRPTQTKHHNKQVLTSYAATCPPAHQHKNSPILAYLITKIYHNSCWGDGEGTDPRDYRIGTCLNLTPRVQTDRQTGSKWFLLNCLSRNV